MAKSGFNDKLATMTRGSLRVYLGAAPGVGKTYSMLNEGWRRFNRGTDVVIGWIETRNREGTISQLRGLEIIPPRVILHQGEPRQEMDVDAILARNPAVVLVDDLAHVNVPGARNDKRWRDIDELLDAGINVIATLNIQHLESLNGVVETITGIIEHDTVPDQFVRASDQIELVDMTPEALRRRMVHGHILPTEQVDVALANYFRPGSLAALRELALLWVADDVENRLQEYRQRHGIDEPWEIRERVLVALTGSPNGENLIRRAARIARRVKGDFTAVHVRNDDGEEHRSSELERLRVLTGELGGTYREVYGTDVASALVKMAERENATQIIMGASRRSKWARLKRGSIVNLVIAKSGESIDVHVISPPAHMSVTENDGSEAGQQLQARSSLSWHKWQRLGAISRRRRMIGLLLALILLPAVAVLSIALGGGNGLSLGTISLLFLLPVVACSAVGGTIPGFLTAFSSFLLLNWFFTPPFGSFAVANPANLLTLTIFLVVAGVISIQVDLVARRSQEARTIRSHAASLARTSSALVNLSEPIPTLIDEISRSFLIDGVSLISTTRDGWEMKVVRGLDPPASPADATLAVPIGSGQVLALKSSLLAISDQEALKVFIDQISVAVTHRELREQADQAVSLAKANEMRTALLAAVSHDLRTPLASIKTAVSSLLATDMEWNPEIAKALLETVDSEADRLDKLVANLLDMSRVQTGAVAVHKKLVGLDEVVAAALISLPTGVQPVMVEVPETLPHVDADPPLLERAIANLISNARAASPEGSPVRLAAISKPGNWIELQIIDHGRGIAPNDKERVFLPFQRLGDQRNESGVGLGLAVAKGFIEAMGGKLVLKDTPGGGATFAVHLKASDRATQYTDFRDASI